MIKVKGNKVQKILRATALAFFAAISTLGAYAQSDNVWIGRYDKNSGRLSTGNYVPAHSALQQMYPDKSTTEIFQTMLSPQGYVFGYSENRKTRGLDIIEDSQYNFVNPAEVSNWNNTSQKIYWSEFYNTNPTQTYTWSLIMRNGEHAGESVFNNSNILGMGDDGYLVLNANGSFSSYALTGYERETSRTGWETFGGGVWQGKRFDEMLGNMIGYEDGIIIFLEGDSTIVRYGIGGNVSEVSEFTFTYVEGQLGPDLSQYSLGDIIDGKVEGYTYIGWDADGGPVIINVSTIPEPGAFAALGGAAALGIVLLKRRKRK
jgi:hypothetical protein